METRDKQHIFLASPHMSEEEYEKEYVQEAFDTNWIAPLGRNVNAFENEIAEKLNANDAVALSAGTAAIHMALKAVGVGPGDIVFVSSLTFAATVNPVIYQGAVPVFIDSDYETWNMSPIALKRAFDKYERQGQRPKAVVFAHLYGLSADLDGILQLCLEHKCPVIEDAAESLGTKYKGKCTEGRWKYTGTFGDYGILSFNGNKIITSSGGGMLICNTDDAEQRAEKVRFWSTQARDKARWYQHTEIGYNYRMSNIVAGIGRGQLKILDQRVEKKRYIYAYYKQQLTNLKGITLMPAESVCQYSNCWLTAAQISDTCIDKKGNRITPLTIMEALEAADIESRPIWKPLHLQPVYSRYDFISAEIQLEAREYIDAVMGADRSVGGTIFRRGLCLPSDTKMNDEDLFRVCDAIQKMWE